MRSASLSQTGYTFVVSLFFEGNMDTLLSLLVLTLKVATCSLASITVFSGLDPGQAPPTAFCGSACPSACPSRSRLRIACCRFLMEELQNILLSYRLRGRAPAHDTLAGKLRWVVYQVKIIVQSFYPLMLQHGPSARAPPWRPSSSRGTATRPPNLKVLKIKLSRLRAGRREAAFVAICASWVVMCFVISGIVGL